MKITKIAVSAAATLLVLSGCATETSEPPTTNTPDSPVVEQECTDRFLTWAKGTYGVSPDVSNALATKLITEIPSTPTCILGANTDTNSQTMLVWVGSDNSSLETLIDSLVTNAENDGYINQFSGTNAGAQVINLGKYDDMNLLSQILINFYSSKTDRVKEIGYEGEYPVLLVNAVINTN